MLYFTFKLFKWTVSGKVYLKLSMSITMSMWSLRWHFTNKSVTGAPYSIKSYSLSHISRTLWWRVRWLKQCRLKVAAELQQRWRRTNKRRKSIQRSSSSHRAGFVEIVSKCFFKSMLQTLSQTRFNTPPSRLRSPAATPIRVDILSHSRLNRGQYNVTQSRQWTRVRDVAFITSPALTGSIHADHQSSQRSTNFRRVAIHKQDCPDCHPIEHVNRSRLPLASNRHCMTCHDAMRGFSLYRVTLTCRFQCKNDCWIGWWERSTTSLRLATIWHASVKGHYS